MSHDTIRSYYDARYSDEGGESFPPDPSRYRAWLGDLVAPPIEAGSVLDLGCGVGYVCSLLADLGYDVTGVDISPAALELARKREPRVRFVEAEPDGSLPFDDGSFDAVTALGVIEHVPDPAPLVEELHRVARGDATGILVVPNARSPFFWFGRGTGQIEEHPRTLDGWRKLLVGAGWRIENVRRDPGPMDRPITGWKRAAQAMLNRLPLGLTYQFVIQARAI